MERHERDCEGNWRVTGRFESGSYCQRVSWRQLAVHVDIFERHDNDVSPAMVAPTSTGIRTVCGGRERPPSYQVMLPSPFGLCFVPISFLRHGSRSKSCALYVAVPSNTGFGGTVVQNKFASGAYGILASDAS